MKVQPKSMMAVLALGLLVTAQVQAAWNIGYPWGRTHDNAGNAYMTHGGDTMTATMPGTAGKKYNSGGSYSTIKTSVWAGDTTMGAQASCNHLNPVRGVWPAFWMTTEGAWTGEVDIAEWKGNGNVWQNTWDGGWEEVDRNLWQTNATFKAHCWIIGTSNNVQVSLLVNNVQRGLHTGSNFRNKQFWIIRNLQMEGSSGAPGPATARYICRSVSQW